MPGTPALAILRALPLANGSLVATGLGSDAGIVNFDSTREFMETSETIPLVD